MLSNITVLHIDISLLHFNIVVFHVDINKSHVIMIMLHVDIVYLACKGQKYATMQKSWHNYSCENDNIHPGKGFCYIWFACVFFIVLFISKFYHIPGTSDHYISLQDLHDVHLYIFLLQFYSLPDNNQFIKSYDWWIM